MYVLAAAEDETPEEEEEEDDGIPDEIAELLNGGGGSPRWNEEVPSHSYLVTGAPGAFDIQCFKKGVFRQVKKCFRPRRYLAGGGRTV